MRPSKFEAGWRTFTIKTVPDLVEDGEKCWGCTDFDRATISLESLMNKETHKETLLHEITHVILETVGLGADESPVRTNEIMTSQISRGFLQAFNLNKSMFEYLLNTEEEDI